jgi:tryptophan synthase beta subunit
MHGVAAATVAARFGMECVVYMGSEDTSGKVQNVFRMKLLGATVVPSSRARRRLKDALNEAMRDWVTNVESTFYIIGTCAGPHPYPMMVRDFQSVIGRECLTQMPAAAGRDPDAVIACVGGGSNAIGLFHPYITRPNVRLIGVEAAGDGIETGRHAASLTAGTSRACCTAIARTCCRTPDGQIAETHSVSAGLDYPGVGPEHAWLKDTGRAEYVTITDAEALAAFHDCCRIEGIIPALESAHALAYCRAARGDGCRRTRSSRQPLRPRRQGQCTRRRALRDPVLARERATEASSDESHRRRVRKPRRRGPHRLVPYVTVGDPTLRSHGADHARAGKGRSGRDRAGRAVLRIRWPTAR